MKRSTRMMLMNSGKRDGDSRSDRRDYDRPRDNYAHEIYEAEDKFRDRRGREHYDNGRYAPMRGYDDMWVEGRFRDRDGREHYDNGRFAPMRGEYNGGVYDNYGPGMHYMPYPYVPPVYQREDRSRREGWKPMNKIGFALEGEMDKIPSEFDQNYRSAAEHKNMDEMAYRKGNMRTIGFGSGNGYMPFTREMAEEWTSHMENEDGSKGPHWSLEQTKQVQAQRGIECDPIEFWVAMNAEYSDRSAVNKKHNVNTIDFYADSAVAFWLKDRDAVQDKLAAYYEYVVKH